MAVSPDGRWIASNTSAGTIQIWEAGTGRLIRALRGHEGKTNCVAFHPGGRRLASAGRDGTVREWDLESNEMIRVFRIPQGIAISAVYSPDGSRLASAFTDGTVRIWDLGDGREVLRLTCETFERLVGLAANILAFSPDGRQLAACATRPIERPAR